MVRRAAKIDANQTEIVSALRSIGCSVQLLHAVGKGCPDLLVGRNQTNYLIEVKDGAKVPSQRKLTSDQVEWHSLWQGNAIVVKSVNEAVAAVGGFPSDPINLTENNGTTKLEKLASTD